METERKIKKYILRKIDSRKHNRRPVELRYLHVAKGTGRSYDQVRRIFYMLLEEGIIEVFVKWERNEYGRYTQVNFYRRRLSV